MNTADTDDVDGSGDHGNNAGGDNNGSDSTVVVFATPVVLAEQDGGEVDGAGDTRTSGAGVDDATAATIDGWSLQLGMALL